MGYMGKPTEANTTSRAARGARRRRPGAFAATLAAGLACVSVAVAVSAPAGSAAEPPSVEAPAAGSILGGAGGILGSGLESGAVDPGRPLRQAAPARATVGGFGAERFQSGSDRSRGHGFVRGARGFAKVDAPGATLTAALSSNDGRQIVGYYLDARKRFHGFVRDGDRFRRIDFPGAKGTFAAGIDDQGRVVGSYTNERGTPAIRSAEHGFLLDGRGRFRRIDVPGATATRPEAINNRAQIAGAYVDGAGTLHGYFQNPDGSVTTIDPPGAGATVVTDLDDQGRAVGAYVDAKQTAISAFVREPDGRFTTISHPDAGFYGTVPEGINNEGQIAGTYSDANDRTHGFVLDDGVYTTVDAPDAPGNTQVLDIDDRRRLVGESGHVSYGYLADGRGGLIEIDAPAVASDTFPSGINNRGDIVGASDRGAARSYHGFLRDRRGRYRRIDVPGARGTAAARINDSGEIVGYYSDTSENPNVAGDSRGFLLDRRGRFERIDVPGATTSQALGINNLGEIGGGYVDAAGAAHGFLRGRDGELTTIDVPNAAVTIVLDINDRGQTAGIYLDADGKLHGFRRERSGAVTTIDVPGASQTRVRGINNRGQVAIDTVDAQLVHHSFLLDRGRFTEIKPRGVAGNGSLATDVDDRGRVLGSIH
jgi:probable HAF family extracellular repeat protein